jgi:molybdate/tungstate transport system substrate-binding protein
MWGFATSMAAATPVWIVVVIVVAAGAGAVGFYGGYAYRGSPASHTAAVENDTLSILGAGTLTSFFPTLAGELVNETPGVTAPGAAQQYEGSLDVTTAVASLDARADIAAVADFRLIPTLLEPRFASYEVVFAATPEVLVYNASLAAFAGIDEANWGSVLYSAVTTHGVPPLAVWNASTDPNGYNEIFDMMLQGLLYGGNNDSVYGHFYLGAPGEYATPNPAVTQIDHESDADELLQSGTVSALITYRSYAIANHLSYVSLDPIVGLAANNTTALADYATVSTQILSSSGSLERVVPAPVLFAATVPSDAPNPALGAAFLHLLVSPQGSAVLEAGEAFTPIFPAWTNNVTGVPSVLAPDVTSLPAWAGAFLA